MIGAANVLNVDYCTYKINSSFIFSSTLSCVLSLFISAGCLFLYITVIASTIKDNDEKKIVTSAQSTQNAAALKKQTHKKQKATFFLFFDKQKIDLAVRCLFCMEVDGRDDAFNNACMSVPKRCDIGNQF